VKTNLQIRYPLTKTSKEIICCFKVKAKDGKHITFFGRRKLNTKRFLGLKRKMIFFVANKNKKG
jgi:hypothetical protein